MVLYRLKRLSRSNVHPLSFYIRQVLHALCGNADALSLTAIARRVSGLDHIEEICLSGIIFEMTRQFINQSKKGASASTYMPEILPDYVDLLWSIMRERPQHKSRALQRMHAMCVHHIFTSGPLLVGLSEKEHGEIQLELRIQSP